MKFKEFNNSLPNGLHDAHISTINIDYINHRIDILAEIWIGNLESNIEAVREEYRDAKILITNFKYIIFEKPDQNYEYSKKATLWIDAGEINELKAKPKLPALEMEAFNFWIYVNNWNSFIYISAEDITIEWK